MTNQYQILFCTCPSAEVAERLASLVVEKKLAACVNIIPKVTSIFQWQGKLEIVTEQLLLIKSHEDVYASLETLLRNEHPYEVPEIIAISLANGLPEYLRWLSDSLAR